MGLFGKRDDIPETISDEDYAALQDRARKANPERDRLGSPEGTRHRNAAALQHDQAHLS